MVHIAKIIWTRAWSSARSARDCGDLDEVIVDCDSVDCWAVEFRGGTALQDDLIGGAGHRADIRMLESGDPSIDGQGVQKQHFKKNFDIRKEALLSLIHI